MMTVLEEFYGRFKCEKIKTCTTYDDCPYCYSNPCDICDTDFAMDYPPITLQVERELEELIRKTCGIWMDGTTNTECWKITSKRPKQDSGWHKEKQEALLSLCIKLADELGEEFVEEVRRVVK